MWEAVCFGVHCSWWFVKSTNLPSGWRRWREFHYISGQYRYFVTRGPQWYRCCSGGSPLVPEPSHSWQVQPHYGAQYSCHESAPLYSGCCLTERIKYYRVSVLASTMRLLSYLSRVLDSSKINSGWKLWQGTWINEYILIHISYYFVNSISEHV